MVNVIGLSVKTRHSRLYFCIVWHKLFVNLTDCFFNRPISFVYSSTEIVRSGLVWFGLSRLESAKLLADRETKLNAT